MLTARIQIPYNATDTSTIVDITEVYHLVYLSSDHRVAAPSKALEAISYPEEEGEHIYPDAVDAPFDYKVKFFIQAASVALANQYIAAFNSAFTEIEVDEHDEPTGRKTYKRVAFFNDYKRHRIVGYPSPISEATEYWHDKAGLVNNVIVVEWTIRVTKPSLCDFNVSPTPPVEAEPAEESR